MKTKEELDKAVKKFLSRYFDLTPREQHIIATINNTLLSEISERDEVIKEANIAYSTIVEKLHDSDSLIEDYRNRINDQDDAYESKDEELKIVQSQLSSLEKRNADLEAKLKPIEVFFNDPKINGLYIKFLNNTVK